MQTLIIGYGNPLREDDGVGWRVGEQLANEALPDVQVLLRHQLTPELAEPISKSKQVIFIDACVTGETGSMKQEQVSPARTSPARFSHQTDPAGLLSLAELLYGACPAANIIAVSGERFGYREQLSPRIQAALPAVIRRVHELLGIENG